MEVQVKEIISHEIQITLHADIWNEMTGIVTKSKGVTEIVAFNAIKRIGSTYKKQLCYVPYMSDAREMAIIDTLKVVGIPDYINIKAYRDDRSGCYAEYTRCDNSIQHEHAIVKLYKGVRLSKNPVKAPNANNETLDFSYKWTMWIDTTANQRYECVWDLKKVQCYSLKPNGRRWLTLLPMRKEGQPAET